MSIEKINLRKLLQLFYADTRLQQSLLRQDIREDRRKERGGGGSGGDFYSPFWADVKDHAAGRSNLIEQTNLRVGANKRRGRLYPILTDSFLAMWEDKMRWRNEPFEFVPEGIRAQLKLDDLGLLLKIENTVSVKVWDGSFRVIYPYFSEMPPLPDEAAKLGFWVLGRALPSYRVEDFRIVDMLRRAYFRPADVKMTGDEETLFGQRYRELRKIWLKLRDEP